MKLAYFLSGITALIIGGIGIVLPLVPTVPLFILAAYCFARSSPRLEQWLITHPRYGQGIAMWRERGAISAKGKRSAMIAFVISVLISLALFPYPWSLAPILPILIVGTWIVTRPEA